MYMNIIAGIICAIMVAAGIWCWWIENVGGSDSEDAKTPEEKKDMDLEEKKKAEKQGRK